MAKKKVVCGSDSSGDMDVENLLASVDGMVGNVVSESIGLPAAEVSEVADLPGIVDTGHPDYKESDLIVSVCQVVSAYSGGECDGPMVVMDVDGRVDPPAPGIYHDVPFELYQSWNALNASSIDYGLVSMEHMKANMDGLLSRSSQAMDFGKAIHMKLLEPELFAETYSVSMPCQRQLKTGKNKGCECGYESKYRDSSGTWLCGVHAGDFDKPHENVLTPSEYKSVFMIENKVKEHPVVGMLRSHGGCESSCVFQKNGLWCKFRTDKIIFAQPNDDPDKSIPWIIVDVKKVASMRSTDRRVAKSIGEYNYDMRAAWYVDGLQAIVKAPVIFIWVFVEDTYPYAVNVIQMDDDTLRIGRELYEPVVRDYLKAIETGVWNGCSYSHAMGKVAVKLGGSPEWKRKQHNAKRSRGEYDGDGGEPSQENAF